MDYKRNVSKIRFFIFIFAFIIFGIGFNFNTFAQIVDTKAQLINSIIETESNRISTDNSYTQYKLGDLDPYIEVHIYKTPKGEDGYQVIERSPDNSWVSSQGFGPEADKRTYLINLLPSDYE